MREWWRTCIYGCDVGVVVEHWRAKPIAPDVYKLSGARS